MSTQPGPGPAPSAEDAALLAAVYPQASWPPFDPTRAALLVIDLQRLCIDPQRGMFEAAARLGRPDLLEPYRQRVEEVVVPHAADLAAAFRAAGRPVIFTKIESRLPSGEDRSPCHRALDLTVTPGAAEGEFLPALVPAAGDVVLAKTASDAFVGTGLDELLRNAGITHLAVVGVLSHECVESTTRHAADLGYTVQVVEDACGAVEHDRHEMAMRDLGQSYAVVTSTAALRRRLEADPPAAGHG